VQSLLTISRLRRARLNAGRSLQEIALETRISASKLSAAERGLVALTRAEQRILARVLGASAEALFASEEPAPC
jgi:transcriptional regulator with XRE-family HTH domain